MKYLTFPVLSVAAALSVVTARPVFAAALVHPIPESQAQGGGAQVAVWPGSGLNIDFTRTGEVIQKVWLDDPSRLTIDFDGSLSSGGNQGGNSESTGASVIHLRQVTGISFPNLPRTASTLLSVVTQTADGKRKVYQFEVDYGSGTPQYATVAIMPESDSGRDPAGVVIGGGRTASLEEVELGLRQAVLEQIIAADSPVVSRVQDFLARVRNGASVQTAADAANISMAVISRLAEMGQPEGHLQVISTSDPPGIPVTASAADSPTTARP